MFTDVRRNNNWLLFERLKPSKTESYESLEVIITPRKNFGKFIGHASNLLSHR